MNTEYDIYSPPKSKLKETQKKPIPEKIYRKIKLAWMAGIFSLIISIIAKYVYFSEGEAIGIYSLPTTDVEFLIRILFVLALIYGIYRKSRICATFMFTSFLLTKLASWQAAGFPIDIGNWITSIPAFIILWCYGLGVIGTFQYHKHIRPHTHTSE